MVTERIYLYDGNEDVYLDVYAPEKFGTLVRDALLIFPGGGYSGLCANREGEQVAHAFLPYGFNAFVLHYTVKEKAVFPRQLIEASLAMKYIKDNAERLGHSADRVFVTGFSAGGHLCAALGTLWHSDEIQSAIDAPFGCNRPAGIIPVYPVVSSNPEFSNKGSFDNMLGAEADDETRKKYSVELYVDERSAPAFIVHTAADDCVSVRNSIALADAYAKAKVPFEVHIFEKCDHGMGLANEITAWSPGIINPHNARWVSLAAEWAKDLKTD